jgi:hypothetical protein
MDKADAAPSPNYRFWLGDIPEKSDRYLEYLCNYDFTLLSITLVFGIYNSPQVFLLH